ncbi:hypothetical protein SESBI_32091 [Sesbania bispinosa]|nr:hypothetical protein SESBI_32091 [Sesbania bispinosa]
MTLGAAAESKTCAEEKKKYLRGCCREQYVCRREAETERAEELKQNVQNPSQTVVGRVGGGGADRCRRRRRTDRSQEFG